MTEIFDPKFRTETTMHTLNFIGAAIRYFDGLNKDNLDATKDAYIIDYNTRIFPLIEYEKPMGEYDEEYIFDLINRIKVKFGYAEGSIKSTFIHLIYDIWECYLKEFDQTGNPRWAAAYKYTENEDDPSSVLGIIPRSLTHDEEIKMAILLHKPQTSDGRMLGLAIMAYTGVRNNEACGLYFRDFFKLKEHEKIFCLRIKETSTDVRDIDKTGGKTYNSPRLIPVLKLLQKLLQERMDYICSQITFPYVNDDGVIFDSVLDLPIACYKNDFSKGCISSDLSRAGAAFFKDEMKLKENRVAAISNYLLYESDDSFYEKDPTTYLLRRNFATHLYVLGFLEVEAFYYIGHKLESDRWERSDFTDEDLLATMKEKLDNHIANSTISTQAQI